MSVLFFAFAVFLFTVSSRSPVRVDVEHPVHVFNTARTGPRMEAIAPVSKMGTMYGFERTGPVRSGFCVGDQSQKSIITLRFRPDI